MKLLQTTVRRPDGTKIAEWVQTEHQHLEPRTSVVGPFIRETVDSETGKVVARVERRENGDVFINGVPLNAAEHV